MSKYTIADVANIVPENLTPKQIEGVEAYLNEGIIPEPDPCLSCDPNFIRKLISLIQTAERTGMFPPKRIIATGSIDDPEVDFGEVFTEDSVHGELVGSITVPEVDEIEATYPELFVNEGTDEQDNG